MNFVFLSFISFVLATDKKECTPVGGPCHDIKDQWPNECCDAPAETKLEKFCEARDKRDWLNGEGTCVHRSSPKGRVHYRYMGTNQCSRDECYYDTDCCEGNYCDKRFKCIPRATAGEDLRNTKKAPCIAKQNCEKKAASNGYHYVDDTERCEYIKKGKRCPCNRGYRNQNMCIQRCLKMDNTKFAGPTLEISLQKDYDEMAKWANAPPAKSRPNTS